MFVFQSEWWSQIHLMTSQSKKDEYSAGYILSRIGDYEPRLSDNLSYTSSQRHFYISLLSQVIITNQIVQLIAHWYITRVVIVCFLLVWQMSLFSNTKKKVKAKDFFYFAKLILITKILMYHHPFRLIFANFQFLGI